MMDWAFFAVFAIGAVGVSWFLLALNWRQLERDRKAFNHLVEKQRRQK